MPRGSGKPVPKNWPTHLTYLANPSYSSNLTPSQLTSLNTPSPSDTPSTAPSLPASNVRIQSITSSSHPANGQYGLFATANLPPNSLVVPYVGFVHGPYGTDSLADASSDYDLTLGPRELGIGIDASRQGNEGRFVNDFRGVRDTGPNAEFREVWVTIGVGKSKRIERWMGVFVLPAGKSGKNVKGIRKGEEIVVSYGKGFWQERAVEVDQAFRP